MNRFRVLFVDDDPACRQTFEIMGGSHFAITTTGTYGEAIRTLTHDPFDAVIVDVDLGDGPSGIDLVREVRRRDTAIPVIMLSSDESAQTIVDAMRAGANDYVPKAVSYEILWSKIERCNQESAWKHYARASAGTRSVTLTGSSAVMRRLRDEIAKIAPTSLSVLLTGESGSGKQPVAEAIHGASKRAAERFVAFNGASMTDDLFEASLFGHERGAFTGANERRLGWLELADKGTFFLDEIGKVPLHRQAKLLRVLDSGEFERVGGRTAVVADFRLISACNENLQRAVAAGTYSRDFHERIKGVRIEVPPLRDRLEDIPELARTLLDRFAAKEGWPGVEICDGALAPCFEHSWPGNIRELNNVLCVAAACSPGAIDADAVRRAMANVGSGHEDAMPPDLPSALLAFERSFIDRALRANSYRARPTWEQLRMTKPTFYRRCKDLGIALPGREGEGAAEE